MKVCSAILGGVLAAVLASGPLAALAEPAPQTAVLISKLRAAAQARGLPPDIAEAVGFVETGFDPSRIGAAGEIGLMQVMPDTAAMLGFRGTNAELADVDVNIRYGVRYLAAAWELAGHDLCRALTKYRAGHGAESMSERSVIYCRRARGYLASLHSPLAAGADPIAYASPGDDGKASRRPAPVGRERGERYWAREEARVRALDAETKARWALIAAYNARVQASGPSRAKKARLVAELRALSR